MDHIIKIYENNREDEYIELWISFKQDPSWGYFRKWASDFLNKSKSKLISKIEAPYCEVWKIKYCEVEIELIYDDWEIIYFKCHKSQREILSKIKDIIPEILKPDK